jgi:hypothetical protein
MDPDTGANATMARPEGTIARPAATAVSPNPLAAAGCCSCWVLINMLAIRAKPTRIEAMLVSRMGRRADVRRSTSGWLTFSE